MPKVADLSAVLKIYVNAGDHAPPHFHVIGPDVDFTVRLSDLRILAGTARLKEFNAAVAWARQNGEFLATRWAEYNERD